MRLGGRRESQNVEDRRGRSVGKASLGVGGMIVVGLLVWLMGGNPMEVLRGGAGALLPQAKEQSYQPTEQEEALKTFAAQILAGTEDVWTKVFAEHGLTYQPARLVIFNDRVQSGCGNATSSTGPFYCSADQTVYIDLSFFTRMKEQLGAGGDFAYAYVIAHEIGHHVQYQLGVLQKAHEAMQRAGSQKEANAINVRLELQADYYAGLWAHHDNQMFGSLEPGDLDEGLRAASAIGDDKLQMEAQGYTIPDTFNHGTSAQRSGWLHKGFREGTLEAGDTFSLPDPQ